jgi:hypothetical protein
MASGIQSLLGGGNILGSALQIAGLFFPPAAIAGAAANLITQVAGQVANQAAQQLCQESGMPSFVKDMIQDIVKDVIGKLTGQGNQECQDQLQDKIGGALKELGDDMTKSVVDFAKSIMELGGGDDENKPSKGGKGGGSASWLVAIAKAMGAAAGKHAEKLVDLSQQIEKASGGTGEEAKKVTGLQAEFQAESQMFSMLQSAFSNAIKSIGEGMAQMARKG